MVEIMRHPSTGRLHAVIRMKGPGDGHVYSQGYSAPLTGLELDYVRSHPDDDSFIAKDWANIVVSRRIRWLPVAADVME